MNVRKRIVTAMLIITLPFTMASECKVEPKDSHGKDGVGGVEQNGKCIRKKLAGVGGLEKQEPNPDALGCDERILWLVGLGTAKRKTLFTIRHNAWGRFTLEDVSTTYTQGLGDIMWWQEAVVTYKDRAVTFTVRTNRRPDTDTVGCYIYDYPPPWKIRPPLATKTIGPTQMSSENGEVQCYARGLPV